MTGPPIPPLDPHMHIKIDFLISLHPYARPPIKLLRRIKSILCYEEEGHVSYEWDGPSIRQNLFFSNQRKILEIQKCYSMALMATFGIPKIKCPDILTDSRICVEVEKCQPSSLQTSLNCQAKYPLETDISVGKFSKCLPHRKQCTTLKITR